MMVQSALTWFNVKCLVVENVLLRYHFYFLTFIVLHGYLHEVTVTEQLVILTRNVTVYFIAHLTWTILSHFHFAVVFAIASQSEIAIGILVDALQSWIYLCNCIDSYALHIRLRRRQSLPIFRLVFWNL